MNKKIFIFTLFLVNFVSAEKPIVYIDLPALLGNRLWGLCVAKIIAHELHYDLHCKSIWGFPNTYCYQPNYSNNSYTWESHECHQDINLKEIIQNKNLRNIKINGYFQRYHYLEPYAELIRKDWLKIDPAMLQAVDKDDIIVHVRIHDYQSLMKFEYYEKALSMAKYKQLYICTNEPEHAFIKQFAPYKPIICSSRSFMSYFHHTSWDDISKLNIDDFTLMASFNKIIISYSTYSWWAAYLSNATEIYAPYSDVGFFTEYGKVNEPRYTYIDTEIII